MDKPIVLFLIDGLQVGGAERSMLEISRRFNQFTPVICVLSPSLALLPEFEKSGIRVVCFPLPRNYRFAKNARRLLIQVEQIQPVLIHSCLFHSDMILRYLPVGIPKVTGLVSNSYSRRRLSQLPWKVRLKVGILKFWDKTSSNKIDLFISNSNVIKNAYSEEMGLNLEKITVIPRGRDLGKFKQPIKKPSSGRIFISVGRLIPSKGFEEMIRAFVGLSRRQPVFQLIIAGDGPDRPRLASLVNSLGLAETVSLPGTVENIEDFYASASFFVFPSHYEGLPGSLIEAMMARVPIICSDIPENKECVDESMCLFHRVGDQGDLLAQMEKALALSDWADRTQRAFDYAATHFEIGKIARRYEEVYQSLLENQPNQ